MRQLFAELRASLERRWINSADVRYVLMLASPFLVMIALALYGLYALIFR